jgi:CRISPR/Cas system Type II protein with McrA/HNH and RuvC-like nuclease domain
MPIKTIPISYIRGLLITQNGRCAISGVKLHPHELNADHIVPLSRVDLSPTLNEKNIWLVHKSINAMKGTLTYSELIDFCHLILKNQEASKQLLEKIQKGKIEPLSKNEFDIWVKNQYPK